MKTLGGNLVITYSEYLVSACSLRQSNTPNTPSSGEEQEYDETLSPVSSHDSALRRESREQIQSAFAKLPAKLRLAVTMALIEERPYSEIAQALGVPEGTVKSRVFRAVRILRQQLNRMGVMGVTR